MQRIILSFLILTLSVNLGLANDKLPAEDQYFSLDGTSSDKTKLMEEVFGRLQSGGLTADYPKYGKAETVQEPSGSYRLMAVPIESVESADAILINDKKFVTFEVWELNTRANFFTDTVYLLRERDSEAIKNGFKGFRRFKTIEVCYTPLMPVLKTGIIGGDFSEANKVIDLVRDGLLKAGCKKIRDP